jgi:gliding motility-associated-like protein
MTASYTYVWSNAQTGDSVTGLAAGAYGITVTDTNGCSFTHTFQIFASSMPCEIITPVIYVPNIFSPNDDGFNDILFVRGRGVRDFTFIIYDRWGGKVFTTTELTNGWNGKYHGELAGNAVYVYYLTADMDDGSKVNRKGTITLVR